MKKLLAVISVAVLFLASCSAPLTKQGPSEDLAETVHKFYELKMLGKHDQAWYFERMSTDENEERRENTRLQYIARSGDTRPLKSVDILEIGEEGSGTQGFTPVKIKVVSPWPALPFPTPEGDYVATYNDLWEKINGKWYHVVAGRTKFW